MAGVDGPWREGREAWQRLNGWYQDHPAGTPTHLDSGPAAVEWLADIDLVRRMLDQAELVAVRTARRHGQSWTDIAAHLGITRQSAWERWHDLDESHTGEPASSPGGGRSGKPAKVAREVSRAAGELIGARPRRLRRDSTVVVPDVVGMTVDAARHELQSRHLVAVGPDPDGPPLVALGAPSSIVTDQSPEAGAKMPIGSPVTLWLGRGGGSAGDREPRRPKPPPRTAQEFREEPTDEAVS